MLRSTRRRAISAWIAALAFLWASVAPTLAHALADPGLPAEVCSATGAKAPVIDDAPPQSAGVHALEHCPYCSLQYHAAALPPGPLSLDWAPAVNDAGPDQFVARPRPKPLRTGASPRAPPLHS